MQRSTRFLVAVSLSLYACVASVAVVAAPPNFVVIVADDMAWDDCGVFGNPHVRTPNIDSLARQGMRFERAMLTISSCSPSRASLLTGRFPHNTDADELHWPLPKEQITFVEILRTAGYWTGAAGKWHLGDEVRDRFDEIREADSSGFQLPTGEAAAAGQFVERVQGNARSGCTEWVPLLRARPRDKPFCLWLAALDPHRPYEPDVVHPAHTPDQVTLPPYHPDTERVRVDYALYYDEITRLDRYVGDVLGELDRQGLRDHTVVIFLSDNGRPFPRDKTTLYDSGIRTPLIIRWPDQVAANSICRRLVSSIDLAPTMIDLAGLLQAPTMSGQSLKNLLENPEADFRTYAFSEKNWHDFEDHARSVRSEHYKYIRNSYADLPNTPPADALRSPTYREMLRLRAAGKLAPPQRQCFLRPRPAEELYDLRDDPFELNNLAESPDHLTVLTKLRTALDEWARRTGDHVPQQRTADEFDRHTGKPTAARRRPRWPKKRMVESGLTAP